MRSAPFVALWIVATTAAITLGGFALDFLGPAFPYAGGLAFGIPLGIAQSLVLRQRVSGTAVWIIATIFGFAFMWLVGFSFAALKGMHATRVFIGFAAATPILGAAQARALRRWTSRAAWWIVASALGWIAFFATIEWMPGTTIIEFVLGGATAGLITGVALARLLRDSLS